MPIKSVRDSVAKLRDELTSSSVDMYSCVTKLQQIPAPKGSSEKFTQLAAALSKAASSNDAIAAQVANVSSQNLPTVWVGEAAEKAGDVVVATAEDLERSVNVFRQAAKIISTVSDALVKARESYSSAQKSLSTAAAMAKAAKTAEADTAILGPLNPTESIANAIIAAPALAGVDALLDAYDLVLETTQKAAWDLAGLGNEARAYLLDSNNLSDSDKLVLTESAAFNDHHDLNLILSPVDAHRIAQLKPDQQQAFINLLSNKELTPEVKAYLTKAFAAGNNIQDIEWLRDQIRNHGNDPAWLSNHLTPIEHTGAQSAFAGIWAQPASQPNSLAAATVMGNAMVDPVYALKLSAGKTDDPNYPVTDGPDAFKQRVDREYRLAYDDGRSQRDDPNRNLLQKIFGPAQSTPGMYTGEEQQIANQRIGDHVGADYQHYDTGSADSRRDDLLYIKNAVDEGKPVPIQLGNSDSLQGELVGQQALVIGHHDGVLDVYNPTTGKVEWCSEAGFVNGRMDWETNLPTNISGVLLPEPNQY